ncbi:MAG: tail fiber domain-containing protein, partial [Paludibacter sp.]
MQVRNDGSVWTGYTGYSNIWMGTYPSFGFDNGQWGIEIWDGNLNFWKPWPTPARTTPVGGDYWNYYIFITPSNAVGIGKAPTHDGICLDVNGTVYANDILITSDERLKNDIKPLTDKIENLYKLNGKSYKKHLPEDQIKLPEQKYSDGSPIPGKNYPKTTNKALKETQEFGFLAQDIKEIYPELVKQDTLGYYYVNYTGIIPLLVEALKEQKAEIEALKLVCIGNNSEIKKVGTNATVSKVIDALTYPVLDQNVPNPFNTSTVIAFYLPVTIKNASIYIYDMNGVQLKSYPIAEKGKGNLTIQGSEFAAGMYLYALIAD